MLRLRAAVRSLTNSDSSGRTRMHEISSGSPIDVDFGILLDERGYLRPRSGDWPQTRSAQ